MASPPRAGQRETLSQLWSAALGRVDGDAAPVADAPRPTTHQPRAPAATAAAPPATTERRCTDRRRSSTRAAGSGGSPWPASRCSTAPSRSTSSAQSAGARPSAARAASWAATSRACSVAARVRTSPTGIPSRSATSSGPAPQTDRAPTRARSRGDAARTAASSAVSTGSSSSSGSVHGPGDDTASGRAAPRAALSTDRRAAAPGRPSSRASRHCWCSVARASVVTRRAVAGSRVTTNATPSRSGQRAATNSRKSSSTVRVTRPVSHRAAPGEQACSDPVRGQCRAAAPSSASSWLSSLAGSNSPVTSQMTR